ncbi:hypothetical protein AN189_03415 [Loktanella sp. 3ANDIMAR09]|nr:hypothetical protein AN189_03415 [Loktanella sp. 3ANDIMAR09]
MATHNISVCQFLVHRQSADQRQSGLADHLPPPLLLPRLLLLLHMSSGPMQTQSVPRSPMPLLQPPAPHTPVSQALKSTQLAAARPWRLAELK